MSVAISNTARSFVRRPLLRVSAGLAAVSFVGSCGKSPCGGSCGPHYVDSADDDAETTSSTLPTDTSGTQAADK